MMFRQHLSVYSALTWPLKIICAYKKLKKIKQKSLFSPHLMHTPHRARETKIEQGAVQLHSARNETKLTAAAAQCATKTRYSRAKSGRETDTAPIESGRGSLAYALTPKLKCSFIASVLPTG